MDKFQDFYEVLQISPNAEPETIHRVYKLLAARLHPDNPETGDLDGFLSLNRAYDVLSDPALRSSYDIDYATQRSQPLKEFDSREFSIGVDGESNRRLGILFLLYRQRRSDPENSGMSLLDLEVLMSTPREHLVFTTWYLREKNLVRLDDRSSLLISAEGVDYVEKNLASSARLYRLLNKGKDPQPARPQESTDALS